MSRAMQFDIVANDKATSTMRATESSMQKFTSNIGANFTKIAIKAALAYAAMSKMKAVFSEGGDIEDGAKRLNITVDAYQRLTQAAHFYGTTVQDLSKGFKDLNNVVDEAASKGSGVQFEALKALGFSDQEIMNREVKRYEILRRLAEAMASVNEEEQKFAVASRILGDKAAMSLQPILDDFKGFEDIMANAKVLTDEQVRNLAKTDDAMDRVGFVAKNLFQQGVAGLAGVFTEDKASEAAAPPGDDARARARALLGTGKPDAKGDAEKSSGFAVTSLQEIGGGLGRGISLAEHFAERTAQATETIAAVATAAPAVAPSSTDITKPSEQSSSGAVPASSAQPSNSIKSMSNAFFRGRSPF